MIPGLDGLRAVAFLLVFFFHARYIGVGWVGVQLFFVLSGFLITGILLDMKKSLPTRKFFLKFYGRRFLRIFPLYYFYLILMGIITTWLISINYRPGWMALFTKQVQYAVFFVYNLYSATIYNSQTYFLAHFWSLSMEEQFYIFWPLLILLIPEKYYKKLFIGVIVLGPFFRVGMAIIYNAGVFSVFASTAGATIYTLPFTYVDAFAFGAYISLYSLPKAKTQFLVLLGLIPALGFGAQYLAVGEFGPPSSFGYPILLPEAYQFIWGYSLLNYFFAVTVYLIVKEGLFVRILELPPFRYLGKISYGLYVYHLPIIWFALDIRDLGILQENAVRPVATAVAFIATLLVASLSYYLMERPLLKLKDRFFPR